LAVAHAAQILVVFSLGLNSHSQGVATKKNRRKKSGYSIVEVLLKTAAAKGKIMAETIKHSVTVFSAPVSIFCRCRFHCYCPC